MNILYISSADFDAPHAPTVRARALAAALSARGCRVTLLGMRGTHVSAPYRYRSIRYPSIPVVRQAVCQISLADRLLAAGDADIVLLRETPLCIQPYLLGRPVFLEVNGLALEEIKVAHGPRRWMTEALYRWGYRRAHEILALTPSIRAYLTERVEVPAEKIHVVTNAVETDRFYSVDRLEARRTLGLDPHIPIVFYVGSYHRQHGIPYLVQAAGHLRSQQTPCLFLMAGSGGDREAAVRAAIEEQNLSPWFRFMGRIDDDTLRLAIGASDICINPAAPETRTLTDATFPQKLLEYMACSRMVLSVGEAPKIVDLLKESGGGAIIPMDGDLPRTIAQTLTRLIAQKEAIRAMGARGAEFVRSRYSYERVVEDYLTRFRKAIACPT